MSPVEVLIVTLVAIALAKVVLDRVRKIVRDELLKYGLTKREVREAVLEVIEELKKILEEDNEDQ